MGYIQTEPGIDVKRLLSFDQLRCESRASIYRNIFKKSLFDKCSIVDKL
jgi:hypothetical protein